MIDIEKLQVGEVLQNKWGNRCVVSRIDWNHPEYCYEVYIVWEIGSAMMLHEDEINYQGMVSTGEINQDYLTFLKNFKRENKK